MKRWSASVYLVLAAGAPAVALAADDLLPDIITRQENLYDNDIVTQGSKRLLRLSNGTPNIGAGKLYLYGGNINPDNTRDVWQRIYRTDGSFYDHLAGKFVYHPGHQHIHFENWAAYRLRQYLDGGGVGDIVAVGAKTSFCILDLSVYDSSLPGFDPAGQFHSCSSTIQGLSVGWMDVYSKGLEGQSIDITNVPDGVYWLESEVDPVNGVIESDDTNNIARIVIDINGNSTLPPDAYEPNDSKSQTDGRGVGEPNSPNLGPCNPLKTITNLSIHEAGNDDYWRFYMPATGGSGDYVRIEFEHDLGDLDMKLLNSSGATLATSEGILDYEQISMNGRAAGWYYVRVYGWNGATNPFYTLKIDPSANGAPSITVVDPPAGDTQRVHGFETYTVTWTKSDPENNETWVSVYVNYQPQFDGNEFMIPTSLNTPGSQGFFVINSAYLDATTYWVYCQITDGGTTSGDWSSGTITFVEPCQPCDTNCDGSVNGADISGFVDALAGGTPGNCSPCNSDTNADGTINGQDIQGFINCLKTP